MILLTGSSGFVGSFLRDKFKNSFLTSLGDTKNSLRNGFEINKFLYEKLNIKSAILLGGITQFPLIKENPDLAFDVNVTKLKKTIDNLLDNQIHITFVSSESVFDGVKGNYYEDEKTSPIFYYGYMKEIIEQHLISSKRNNLYSIIRITKVYTANLKYKSLISEHLQRLGTSFPYPIVRDMYTNPIDIESVCNAIYKISSQQLTGIYHLGGKDIVSRKDIVEKINQFLIINDYKEEIIKAEYKSKRDIPNFYFLPFNTSLNCSRSLKKLDLEQPSIIDCLKNSISRHLNME